jgi:hypothetical protein
VHRLQISQNPSQLYDIVLYAIPVGDTTLASVRHIEYFFGRSWGSQIFTSKDRSKGFPITLSAYGPFLCSAKIVFTDGVAYSAYRFVDFEMAPQGADLQQGKSDATIDITTSRRQGPETSPPFPSSEY